MYRSILKPLKPTTFDAAKDAEKLKGIVWKFFPGLPKRDWLFALQGKSEILVQSPTKPLATEGAWDVTSKPYQTRHKKGATVKFWSRVNFARAINGKRVGIQSLYIRKLKESHVPRDQWPDGEKILLRSIGSYFNDLGKRNGYEIVKLNPICGPSVVLFPKKDGGTEFVYLHELSGTLRVTDSKKFEQVLQEGIGKMRGFGCGFIVTES